jgi:hypothetical protein
MPLTDLSPLTYFKELHLLPRVIFTVGGALFFGGLFIKDWWMGLLGTGLVFVSVGYNFFTHLLWDDPNPPYKTHMSWSNLFEGLLSFAVSGFLLYVVVYHYRHGSLPSFLQPISR